MKNQESRQCRRIIVLDTSALLAGFDPFSLREEQTIVPKVEEEIKKNNMILLRFKAALENGKIIIRKPSPDFLNKVQATATKVGDSFKLSETDVELLALALELKSTGYKPQIVSDDYSIQNVATQLGIEFLALATFGIKRLLEWVRYCPACHREYAADCTTRECQICGTQLKRKPRRNLGALKSK
jgi:UPF0271 protein